MIFLLLLAPTRKERHGPRFRLRWSRPMGLWPKRLSSKQSVSPVAKLALLTSRPRHVAGFWCKTLFDPLWHKPSSKGKCSLSEDVSLVPFWYSKLELGLGSIDLLCTVLARIQSWLEKLSFRFDDPLGRFESEQTQGLSFSWAEATSSHLAVLLSSLPRPEWVRNKLAFEDHPL